ncbi:protein of unknown function [Acidithiobacillus ferrivorans]|uniref:Secreted protein n=1 Tax=Acidithiobacillus ferrivorans TaxID=160808 RepID=A0ABY1MUK3_9PROT|nr:protein of unknown function [Acidithiobacillus ferrivorans]
MLRSSVWLLVTNLVSLLRQSTSTVPRLNLIMQSSQIKQLTVVAARWWERREARDEGPDILHSMYWRFRCL